MAVMVGSARISENGDSGWNGRAKAGDQTLKEVSIQEWYLHSKGWVVLRAKDAKVRNLIAQDMEYACANNLIGYDQSERDTLYNVAKKVKFNCQKVTTKCETDCSALVRVCINYAGISLGNIRTADMVEKIMATGQFEKLTAKKYTESSKYLLRGDILVTKTTGHTVVVLTDGDGVKKEVMASGVPRNRDRSLSGTYITTTTVNMRDKAGLDTKVLTIVPEGKKVFNYGWYSVANSRKWLWVCTTIDGTEYTGFISERVLKK